MSAASSDSAEIATASKRPFDPSVADPSPPSKLQRFSQSDISPADADSGGEAGAESEAMAGARLSRTQRYLVAVEYDGTRFSGSQQQPNQRTVVGVLKTLTLYPNEPAPLFPHKCCRRREKGEEGGIFLPDHEPPLLPTRFAAKDSLALDIFVTP
ncbi:unnamed protein product [Triticum turgidum subsp. durum]|uniref:tRNA pseudouridine synthase n=1 Tax=Triticum turgidum subsp. durum TaxID=4567 RepID=A0A9R1AIP6_TRITD|nr:unnamed protein product [Triticum turgidum subsp. durum]